MLVPEKETKTKRKKWQMMQLEMDGLAAADGHHIIYGYDLPARGTCDDSHGSYAHSQQADRWLSLKAAQIFSC